MKKKIIGLIAVVAFVLTMVLNISFDAKNNNLSDLSLANIEALAKKEWNDVDCRWDCGYYICDYDEVEGFHFIFRYCFDW